MRRDHITSFRGHHLKNWAQARAIWASRKQSDIDELVSSHLSLQDRWIDRNKSGSMCLKRE
jgi:hypothetical protein